MIRITPKDILDYRLVGRFFRAKVVDNNDPDKKGRIKVDLPFYEKVPVGSRPWIRRLMPSFPHGKGMMAIPKIGEEVVVVFDGTLYNGMYLGTMATATEGHIIQDNYPNNWGFKDQYGFELYVNPDVDEYLVIKDVIGDLIKIDKKNKKIIISGQSDVQIDAVSQDNKTVTIIGSSNVNVISDSKVTVTSPSVDIGTGTLKPAARKDDPVQVSGTITVPSGGGTVAVTLNGTITAGSSVVKEA